MTMNATLFMPELCHIHDLMRVEEEAWDAVGENLEASYGKIRARLDAFEFGVTLAMVDGRVAGSQYAFLFHWDGNPESLTSWDEMTCEGWYNRVHNHTGNTGFLVGVGVVPAFRGQLVTHNLRWPGRFKVSELLIARTLDRMFKAGAQRVIGNARVPAYHQRPDLSIEQYCQLRRPDGTHFDPVLRFHERMGAQILKPVEFAMIDEESRNAGCWVVYTQRFNG